MKVSSPNGTKKEEGEVRLNKKEGVWTGWDNTGKKRSILNFKCGKLDGLYTTWNRNGIKEEFTYHEDVKEGSYVRYNDQGSVHVNGIYKANYKTGTWKTWHPNGKLESEYTYRKNLLNGKFEEWDQAGNILRKGKYRNHRLVNKNVIGRNNIGLGLGNPATTHGIRLSILDPGINSEKKIYSGINIVLIDLDQHRGRTKGFKFSLIQYNPKHEIYGISISLFSHTAVTKGIQIGLFNKNNRRMDGLQLGLINSNRAGSGLQVGLSNKSGSARISGLQIGFLNHTIIYYGYHCHSMKHRILPFLNIIGGGKCYTGPKF